MRTVLMTVLLVIALCGRARAQAYPMCPNGVATGCTIAVTCSQGTTTPIFAALSHRQYLMIKQTGFLYSPIIIPTVSTGTAFICIGANVSAGGQCRDIGLSGSNAGFPLVAGEAYEPPQLVSPQNAFRVPSGDVSCTAQFGDVTLVVEQE